jgi:hypothetical protein
MESQIGSEAFMGAGSIDPSGGEGHPTGLRQDSVDAESHSVEFSPAIDDMIKDAIESAPGLAAARQPSVKFSPKLTEFNAGAIAFKGTSIQ